MTMTDPMMMCMGMLVAAMSTASPVATGSL
ncbi:hypothetical protein JOF57_006050 [Mycolicibacterium lutetiense]|uniref:Uncharacterized protein n=1 Tax=Mycolicibacterium lutetiense TaxID=1641992 RepID=A0ABS5A2Z7_9MYCO|nr:hypothetical protein [Mycolicibacterium lutetiense]